MVCIYNLLFLEAGSYIQDEISQQLYYPFSNAVTTILWRFEGE